jgi:hypothetical protein
MFVWAGGGGIIGIVDVCIRDEFREDYPTAKTFLIMRETEVLNNELKYFYGMNVGIIYCNIAF